MQSWKENNWINGNAGTCFHKYLTHLAETSWFLSCYCRDPHHIILWLNLVTQSSIIAASQPILCIIWKAQILSNLLQLQCVAVAYIVVIIDLGTIAPPHIKLKNPNMITKPKILHMVLIWSLKHRHPPSRDFICFRWWENLVNKKYDSQCFQLFLFPWCWSGPKLRGHQFLPLQMWIPSVAFGHNDLSSLS